MISDIKNKLQLLPDLPGCYLMKNSNQDIIYVGKAKNIKNRVKSYFTGSHNQKTSLLVSEIEDFSFIVTRNEKESLILENNLIKKHLPIYNIKLIDDKSYPYIYITEDKYPKIIIKRSKKINLDAFGPYPNVLAAKTTVDILNRIFPFRSNVSTTTEAQINMYMGKSLLGDKIDFQNLSRKELINNVSRFLKGDNKEILNVLKEKMNEASLNLQYERAKYYLDIINSINQTINSQLVELKDKTDKDIITFYNDDKSISIHIVLIRYGKIIDVKDIVFEYINSPLDNVMSYIDQIYNDGVYVDEILFSNNFLEDELKLRFKNKYKIPVKGEKKKLVDIALFNAKNNLENYFLLNKAKSDLITNSLMDIQKIIGIYPKTIEAFDNAFLFNTNQITGMIYLYNGYFMKKEYRTFKHDDHKADDLKLLKDAIYRRYYRLLIDKKELPSLIIVDGAENQVKACLSVLNDLNLKIKVIGLKKDDTHRLNAIVYDNQTVILDRKSELYKFFAKISEEVHRFSISFHRKVRLKSNFKSSFDNIAGIGSKTKQTLLEHFKTVENIQKATTEELKKLKLSEKVIRRLKEEL